MTIPKSTGLGALLLMAGCNISPFQAGMIRPIYGWADGCNEVTIWGSGFTEDVSVSVDGEPLLDVTFPDPATNPLDVGYVLRGRVPVVDLEASAYATVSVEQDGESSEPYEKFFRRACPAPAYPEVADPTEAIQQGAEITLFGCHLGAGLEARVGGVAAPVTPTPSCEGSTDAAVFTAPTLADGAWYLALYGEDGVEIYPALGNGCDPTLPVGQSTGTDDEGNTVDLCEGTLTLVYGGEP